MLNNNYLALFVSVLCIAIPLWLNIKASRFIFIDTLSERNQKILQLLLVWLLPILGAVIVLGGHRSAEPPSHKYLETPDAGEDFGYSGRAKNSTLNNIDDIH